ncbi:MAG TPA: methyltransferase domain-containing protein, partial [Planctomycetaceae bacterium]|nr:methyltransferase domain-containing protein [Planctomycetaceae bacterium]
SWLPELGARCEGGRWSWDFSRAKAADFPGDLAELIARCKRELEDALRLIDPEYRTIAFRAGTYQVQPFRRLFDALVGNCILADTSVFAGGFSDERGYDFRLACHAHQPWFANPFDPQLAAAPNERQLIEIPVTTFGPDRRWFLDNAEGPRLAERFETWLAKGAVGTRERPRGVAARLLGWLAGGSRQTGPDERHRPPAGANEAESGEAQPACDYFVIIGHTKAELHVDEIGRNLSHLRDRHGFEFVSLATLTRTAHDDLHRAVLATSGADARRSHARSTAARPARPASNSALTSRLHGSIPLDRTRVLDLGSTVGFTGEFATLRPWVNIATAGEHCDLADLEFAGHSFDCVCLTQPLAGVADPAQALCELERVLADGGLLVAAVACIDEPAPRVGDAAWHPVRHELLLRLEHAGFVDLAMDCLDAPGVSNSPRADDAAGRTWFVRGWKRAAPISPLERACEIMDWLYRVVEPGEIPEGHHAPHDIIRLGRGLCMAYAVVLGSMLQAEGFDAEWLTMVAEDHPRGRGPRRLDSHEVIVLHSAAGDALLDPMANLVIPHSLEAVLADPGLAPPPPGPDERFRSRGYELYTTREWYSRVTEFWLRTKLTDRIRKQRVRPSPGRRRAAA